MSHLPGSGKTHREGEKLRAVLFDMDGTLVRSDGAWDHAMRELAARHGGQLPGDFFTRSVGLAAVEALGIAHELLGIPDELLEHNLEWIHERVHARFRAAPPRWFRGARELVGQVRAAGLLTGLVTSSVRSSVEAALLPADRARFDVIVCGDEVGAPKPSPEPYLRAAGALGVEPAECVVVEDSRSGVASALAAGCRLVVVASVAAEPGAVYPVVRAIAEVDLQLLRSPHHGVARTVQS